MAILLLLNIVILTLTIWYSKKVLVRDLLGHILTLEIASTVFNLLFGLFLLFGFMEAHPTEIIKNLSTDFGILMWLGICVIFAAIHTFISIILLSQLLKKKI